MQPIQQHVVVPFTYHVHFTRGLFDSSNTTLIDALRRPDAHGPAKVVFAIDDGVLAHHRGLPDQIRTYVDAYPRDLTLPTAPLTIPGGEACKNDPRLVDRIHEAVNAHGIDRHSYVVAIGGGAVLDLVGYAAATAHRGVRHVRVPTTVLAQNDSGVGVKNGINAFGKKNFLGTFAPPVAVLNDLDFLHTLSDRDWRSGISEAVKVALLKDADFFGFIEANAEALAPPTRDDEAMARLIYRCAELHLEHIATNGDPFEMGSSRPLDFGHWAAHKLEQLTDYELRHGEAVAIGLALDCAYAHEVGMLSDAEAERVLATLEAVGYRLHAPELDAHLDEPDHPESVFRGLQEFREHLGGRLTIMLLEGVGQGVEVHEVDFDAYRAAVRALRARADVHRDAQSEPAVAA